MRFAAAALSGVLLFACFPALNWNWLVWVAVLPLLLAAVAERSLWRGFLLGYLAGAIFLAGSCYWFVYVMRRYGGMGMPLAVGVLILFLIVFSAFFGAYGLAETWAAQHSRALALLAAPFLWVAMELARTYLITGFPWNLLGYAVQPVGLRQIASITAVYGLSFLAVTTSVLATACILESQRWRPVIATAIGVCVLVGANLYLAPAEEQPAHPFGTYLVQPNIPLDEAKLEKWIPWKNSPEFRHLVAMSLAAACANQKVDTEPFPGGCAGAAGRAASPPLLIWPENPAPFYFDRDAVFRSALETLARFSGSYVISGTTTFDPSGKHPLNSAVVLDPQGHVVLVYDKIHLVPFGEYVPWWAFPSLVGKITFEAGDFLPGTEYKIARTPNGGIGVFICYESIFPQLVRRLVANGANVLVNVSDDGWFGNSAAAAQHLNMARLRAIENGRYLLRATNDGITAIIDPRGEIVQQLPRYEMSVLAGQFAYLNGRTFYTAHGDVFAWLAAAVAAGLMLASGMGARKKERT